MNSGDIQEALQILETTSRTFFIPINRLPVGLKEAVASAYLCMRAIDEVEDSVDLDNSSKAQILKAISLKLQSTTRKSAVKDFDDLLSAYTQPLAEVSLRLGEWVALAPDSISHRIWDATAAMADRMAHWALTDWHIDTEADLDSYTFSVAGSVGLLLSDLWAWYDGTQTNRSEAIGFGRGLQTVNILRNCHEDKARGVNFFPQGWTNQDMQAYARQNLALADTYTQSLPKGPALDFCLIPLTLAYATLDVLSLGRPKLSRSQVMDLIKQVTSRS
uniref:Phytoene/squalene synthase family protein n=1 Tax=Oscillatoriales cyanobacterium SpSt-402 TaxID=2282168 RepID=A0A832H9Q1_9CYAN